MSRTVRGALIQAHANLAKQEALDKHVAMVEEAAGNGAEVVCLREIFLRPYFCAQQEPHWFETAEPDDGPTVTAVVSRRGRTRSTGQDHRRERAERTARGAAAERITAGPSGRGPLSRRTVR